MGIKHLYQIYEPLYHYSEKICSLSLNTCTCKSTTALLTFTQTVRRNWKTSCVYELLTWAWRVEERRRSERGFQRWPGPAGFGSCRRAGPRCSSAARSPPAPQPPPAAPRAGSAAPGADCGPSAPSASAAALLSPPAQVSWVSMIIQDP